jgi:hypothetical protein
MPIRPFALVKVALVVLPLAVTAAGCDVMDYFADNNPLETKKKPLEGARKPIFPDGVPGVEYNQPPPQPTNSNIPISSVPPPQQEPETPAPQSAAKNRQPAARTARAPQRQTPAVQSDDPWSDARPKQPGGDPWAADGRAR